MIEVKDLRKSYKTGDFVQKALDGVSLNFRDNEFVAILGPSGSGKTTMLNILGGLDHADSGDIVINGTSTKNYKDKDWDTYRNHRIGFIFQSYNLIPHQTILSNVELALTLSGVGRPERKERATKALQAVGLGEHIHKHPSQLSGGQMQRVAIARALVNDPNIVLADEPTGALDTETGIQVMDILKDVARDRLVIMVTHNPDLAYKYATRIVELADGRIISDSAPYDPAVEGVHASAATAGEHAAAAQPAGDAGAAGNQASTAAPADSASPLAGGATAVMPAVGSAADSASAGSGPSAGAAGAQVPHDSKRNARKASMSFLTALSLSFNNLMTKKGRTFLTAFAGSIGIIGIAAILALSNGVNNYISETEEQALTSYPLTITKSSFDISSLLTASMGYSSGAGSSGDSNTAGDDSQRQSDSVIPEDSIMSDMFAQVKNNNLSAFKDYLENGDSGIDQYVNTIQYNYGVTPQVYKDDPADNGVVRLNPSTMSTTLSSGISGSALTGGTSSGMEAFNEMLDNQDVLNSTMTVVDGRWPENYDEGVLVLNKNGQISDYMLYSLGVYDTDAMNQMMQDALNGDEVTVPETSDDFTYDDALGLTFKVLPAADLYQHNDDQNTWTDMSENDDYMTQQLNDNAITFKIVGVVMPSETSTSSTLQEGVAYTPELIEHLMQSASESQIVQDQKANPDVDVFTGKTFDELQNQGADSFDMSSMFTIDEDALKNAFSFDTSAIENSMSGANLDMSSIDTSGMNIDPSDLQIDSSQLQSLFSNDTMAQIMANAPKFDAQAAFGQAGADGSSALTPEQQQDINDASNKLSEGFIAWYTSTDGQGKGDTTLADLDPSEMNTAFQQYLQTPEAQEIVQGLAAKYGEDVSNQVNNAMQNYMTNQFAPYLSNAMQKLMQQAAQTMATQMAQSMTNAMAKATDSMGSQLQSAISGQLQSQMGDLTNAMQNGFSVDPDAFASAIHFNMSQDDLTSLLTNYMNASQLTYDNNMKKLGYADEDNPESISIYPVDFPAKESVIDIIDGYNQQMTDQGRDNDTIQYSDIAGALMSSVTRIVDTISLVLIAFVSISLVVSSIMIGIITYISVLERKKEIGILRAMGASKLNVANVFNAETIIEGLIAGVFAIVVVYIASVPVNAYVLQGWQVPNVMSLPITSALALVGISVLLTFIAGLIPSQSAARRDPVEALRSE